MVLVGRGMIFVTKYLSKTLSFIQRVEMAAAVGQVLQGLMTPGYMATQIDIINSDRVSNTVVKELKPARTPPSRTSGSTPPAAKAH